jgi:phage terminase large subunit
VEKKTVTVQLLAHQLKFLSSGAPEVLLSGSYGSGKTRALCFKSAQMATIPNNAVLLCRKTLNSLKKTTLRTLLEPDGNMPPVLPPGSYRHHKVDARIDLNGGGSIFYTGLDDPMKIRSFNVSTALCDEVIEFSETEYLELMGRLRITCLGVGALQIMGATNPDSPSHWCYKRFFGAGKGRDREAILSNVYDNPFLPELYVRSLEKNLVGAARSRYLLGQWRATENSPFPMLDRSVHVCVRDPSEARQWILGVDNGFSPDPSHAVLVGEVSGSSGLGLHVFAESVQLGRTQRECAQAWNALWSDLGPYAVVDPSAPSLVEEMSQAGFVDVEGADNAVDPGLDRIRTLLAWDGEKEPRLTFDPSCTETWKSFESAAYKPGTTRLVRFNLHGCDAARYAVMAWHSLDARPRNSVFFADQMGG